MIIVIIISITTTILASAEGITILRHNNKTELIVNSAGLNSPENCSIEIELAGNGRLRLKNSQDLKEILFSTGKTAEKIYLHTNLTGFFPETISISETSDEFDIISASIIAEHQESGIQSADIGHIIFSDFESTKNNNWHVYSWNLLPEILIFDTLDYETQSRLFKRLAFFVEKPGFIGRLLPNTELEGRHGWNAHDYRPEDLADFFTKAEALSFQLNEEEELLKDILVNHGIIKAEALGSKFSAGTGAVLSVSRETLPNWRYRFLTHECLHGIFFTNSEYRLSMYKAFSELAPEEVEFWKRLLDYRHYDVENTYLLVNEFMAYSLQQPIEEVDEYFKGFLYKRMVAARPYESDFVANFDKNFSNSFTSAVTKIEKILYSHTGRISGQLANLYPVEVKDSFFNLFPSI